MTTGWRYRLLGPLTVSHRGSAVVVRAAKQRVLLATLLLAANHFVPTTRLAACLWDDEPPCGWRNTLQNHVLRLRRTLDVEPPVHTRPDGYLLHADESSLDLCAFRAALSHAKTAARLGEAHRASALLHEALALWNGPPLADVPSELLHREVVPALAEQRMRAVELRIQVDLGLGRHHDHLAELHELTACHPLRESLWGLRMLALYRSGRRAEALACFHSARRMLGGELGVTPGPELSALHQRILAADPALVTAE